MTLVEIKKDFRFRKFILKLDVDVSELKLPLPYHLTYDVNCYVLLIDFALCAILLPNEEERIPKYVALVLDELAEFLDLARALR